MASLKCNRCGFGIHYHDVANGVEYVPYSQDMWDGLSETDAPIVSYTDENKDFLFVWQCAKCGCIHAMNGSTWRVTRAYVPTNDEIVLESARKYIVFVDYLRDKFNIPLSGDELRQLLRIVAHKSDPAKGGTS